MSEVIGVGVYLLLGLVIAVGIIAIFRNGAAVKTPASRSLAPLVALAAIAEDAQRHNRRDQHALPWAIPPALVPMEGQTESDIATPTLQELSQRLDVMESRLHRITVELKEKLETPIALS